jgi:hypothetical protein
MTDEAVGFDNAPRPVAVVLIALGLEFEAVVAHLENVREERDRHGNLFEVGDFRGERQSWRVTAKASNATALSGLARWPDAPAERAPAMRLRYSRRLSGMACSLGVTDRTRPAVAAYHATRSRARPSAR